MQKRLKASIWPATQPKAVPIEQLSPLDKLNQLRVTMPQAGYIRQAGLLPGILPISSATLWRWVGSGAFPKPIKLSPRITAWSIDEVIEWLHGKGLA